MSFRARIRLQRVGETVARPVGVKELQSRPSPGDHVSFEHNGVIETGRVDHMEGPGEGGSIAKILVVQSTGE
jgi:hypothetical protein